MRKGRQSTAPSEPPPSTKRKDERPPKPEEIRWFPVIVIDGDQRHRFMAQSWKGHEHHGAIDLLTKDFYWSDHYKQWRPQVSGTLVRIPANMIVLFDPEDEDDGRRPAGAE